MVQKRSVQCDYISHRPKILETNDEICVGHLRAVSPWIMMMMMKRTNSMVDYLILDSAI